MSVLCILSGSQGFENLTKSKTTVREARKIILSLLWSGTAGQMSLVSKKSTRRSLFSCQCSMGLHQFLNTLLNLVSRCSKLFDWLAVWIVNKPVLEQLSRRPSFWKIDSATTKRNHYIEVHGLKSERGLEVWPEISIPASRITSTAVELTMLDSRPALTTSKDPAPKLRAKPSAIWERQELRLHANITRFIGLIWGVTLDIGR